MKDNNNIEENNLPVYRSLLVKLDDVMKENESLRQALENKNRRVIELEAGLISVRERLARNGFFGRYIEDISDLLK